MKDDKAKKDPQLAKVFICNTLKALEQYEEKLNDSQQSYSHTLFINACVGLLMVTTEIMLKNLPTTKVNKDEWGINPDEILYASLLTKDKGKLDDRSVQNVARLMRNSIAHFGFSFDYNENKSIPINEISFELDEQSEFKVKNLSFSSFKTFVLRVAKELL